MHFIAFEDGRPMEVHQFKQPTIKKHYIWQPPKRDKPYMFKAGKSLEPIYGFMFTLTEADQGDITNYSRWSDRIPTRLKPTLKILELIFSRDVDDYAKDLKDIYSLLAQDLLLITSEGVRASRVLAHQDIANESDCVLSTSPATVKRFLNMVNHNVNHHKQSRQEAYETALDTRIFGDHYYAQIPNWWLEASNHYGFEVKI